MTAKLTLSMAEMAMWNPSETDYGAWVCFVGKHMGEYVDFEVEIQAKPFGQGVGMLSGPDRECTSVHAALGILWDAFCAANPQMDILPPGSPRQTLEQRCRRLADALKGSLPSGTGFCLILFDFGADGNMAYMSNAKRADMIATMRELIEKIEAGN